MRFSGSATTKVCLPEKMNKSWEHAIFHKKQPLTPQKSRTDLECSAFHDLQFHKQNGLILGPKQVFIFYFTTTCSCRDELKSLTQTWRSFDSQNVQFADERKKQIWFCKKKIRLPESLTSKFRWSITDVPSSSASKPHSLKHNINVEN